MKNKLQFKFYIFIQNLIQVSMNVIFILNVS